MLPKSKYPHLNRAARRHPRRIHEQTAKVTGWAAVGSNWLLAGLFLKGKIVGPDNITGGRDLTKVQRAMIADRSDPNYGAVV